MQRACQQQNKPHPSALKSSRKRGRRNAKVFGGLMAIPSIPGVIAAAGFIAAAGQVDMDMVSIPGIIAAEVTVAEFAAVQLEAK